MNLCLESQFCPIGLCFVENQHTLRGQILHEYADHPGYQVAKGVTLLRALPIWSDRLGLRGRCDIVEKRPDGALYPVEFKAGKRRRWVNDDAQLCAQALCLEDMFATSVSVGAIFHAGSKRRREVEFTMELRAKTERAVSEVHKMLLSQVVPPAEYRPACEECSLIELCKPKFTSSPDRVRRLASDLFET